MALPSWSCSCATVSRRNPRLTGTQISTAGSRVSRGPPLFRAMFPLTSARPNGRMYELCGDSVPFQTVAHRIERRREARDAEGCCKNAPSLVARRSRTECSFSVESRPATTAKMIPSLARPYHVSISCTTPSVHSFQNRPRTNGPGRLADPVCRIRGGDLVRPGDCGPHVAGAKYFGELHG